MTRKDYIKIAEAIAKIPVCDQKRDLIREISVVLSHDNQRFNYAKFIAACYKTLDDNWIK